MNFFEYGEGLRAESVEGSGVKFHMPIYCVNHNLQENTFRFNFFLVGLGFFLWKEEEVEKSVLEISKSSRRKNLFWKWIRLMRCNISSNQRRGFLRANSHPSKLFSAVREHYRITRKYFSKQDQQLMRTERQSGTF